MSREIKCPNCGGRLSRLYSKEPPYYSFRPINLWQCEGCSSFIRLETAQLTVGSKNGSRDDMGDPRIIPKRNETGRFIVTKKNG
jgi:hypothetical protein